MRFPIGPTEWTIFKTFLREGPCSYCGKLPDGELHTLDHIRPKSQGNVRNYANSAAACYPCNNAKGCKELIHHLLERE